MNTFLDLARQGKNEWWRFILSVLLIFFMWQILGGMPGLFLVIYVLASGSQQTNETSISQLVGVEQIPIFIIAMLASVFFLGGIYLAIHYIHKRSFWTLINPVRALDWRRFFQGFGTWFILSGFMSLVEALFYPGRYVLTNDFRIVLPFAILAIILVPIQTSTEELFFRSYVLQSVGLRFRNIWILSTISGIIFMFPHLLNPEARINFGLMGFYYFFIGAIMAYVTLRDGRLELALGLHAANNLFSMLIANYKNSILPTPSLYTIIQLDPIYSVTAAVIGLLLFVLVVFRIYFSSEPGGI